MSKSCMSCGGCFTGTGCGTTNRSSAKNANEEIAHFQALIQLASSSSAAALNDSDAKHLDHTIPTIISELSKNVFASQSVLYKAMDELPLTEFLNLAQLLHKHRIVGHHIAWAGEYCQGNVLRLKNLLLESTDMKNEKLRLCQHCDDQAEMHELFSQMPAGSVGRTLFEDKNE